jgi:hypothetical protein
MFRHLSRPRRVRVDRSYLQHEEGTAEDVAAVAKAREERANRLVTAFWTHSLPSADQLRQAVLNQPFRAFSVMTVDGRNWQVKRPDLVAIAADGSRLAIFDADGLHLVQTVAVTLIAPLRAPRTCIPRSGPAGPNVSELDGVCNDE